MVTMFATILKYQLFMKYLFSQLVKLEITSLVVEMAALVALHSTYAMVTTTS